MHGVKISPGEITQERKRFKKHLTKRRESVVVKLYVYIAGGNSLQFGDLEVVV